MKSNYHRVAAAGVLSLSLGLGLAASAAAQDRPAPGAAQAARPREGDRQARFEDMQHRREQRLHDLLQIKPDQENAFRAFLASLEQLPPDRERGAPQIRREDRPLTTAERLDRALQRATEAQQRLQKASSAVKTFYAVLTPEQKKAFDTLPILVGGGGRFGGRVMLMRGRFEGPMMRFR